MRRNTFVVTPPSGLIVTLAEAKDHLRVDDVTPGAEATISFGTGNGQLVLTSRIDGEFANSWSAELIEDGLNTPLSVSYAGDTFTINLATDGAGAATSTPNDVIAALLNNATIAQKITATHGAGLGTTALIPDDGDFTGGVDGVSPHDTYINLLLLAIQPQVEIFLRRSLLPQELCLEMDGFPCERFISLELGPIRLPNELTVEYFDVNGDEQTLSTAQYTVDSNSIPPVVILEPSASWPYTESLRRSAISVTYKTGFASASVIPEPIKHAIKFILGHFFTNRESVQVNPGITALTIPQSAEWLLWPYRDFRF